MNRLTGTESELKFNEKLETYSRKIIHMKPLKRENAGLKELRNKVVTAEEEGDRMCKYQHL